MILTPGQHLRQVSRIIRNNHWGRADAFTKLEQYDDAIAAFDATLAAADANALPEIRLDRAPILIKNGDYESAAQTVEEITPDINMDLLGRKSNVAVF